MSLNKIIDKIVYVSVCVLTFGLLWIIRVTMTEAINKSKE